MKTAVYLVLIVLLLTENGICSKEILNFRINQENGYYNNATTHFGNMTDFCNYYSLFTGWCESCGTVCSADCSAVVGTSSNSLAQNIPKPLV